MVYISKFNKPKNHDDSKFVGGIAYSQYKPEEKEEYNFYDFSPRLTLNGADSGILGTAEYDGTSQDTPAESTTPVDTSALETPSEESEITQPELSSAKTFTPKRGFAQGAQNFRQFYEQSGAPMNEYDFGARKAQDESGFRYDIVGRYVDPETKEETTGLGLFQQLDTHKSKPMPVARQYSGVGKEEYLSNPIIQIQAAQRMKNDILRQFTEEDGAAAREKGYTVSAMVAGAGAGGVGGVRNWLHHGYNAVDVHFKHDPNNKRAWECSVAGQMELLNGYFKKGGVLKFHYNDKLNNQLKNIRKGSYGMAMPVPEGVGKHSDYDIMINNGRETLDFSMLPYMERHYQLMQDEKRLDQVLNKYATNIKKTYKGNYILGLSDNGGMPEALGSKYEPMFGFNDNFNNAYTIYDLGKKYKLTDNQIAVLIANGHFESKGNPGVSGANNLGIGHFNGTTRANYETGAKEQKLDPTKIETQFKYLIGPYMKGRGVTHGNNPDASLEDLSYEFWQKVESPGMNDKTEPLRFKRSKLILDLITQR